MIQTFYDTSGIPSRLRFVSYCAVRWPYYMLCHNLQLSKNLLTLRLPQLKNIYFKIKFVKTETISLQFQNQPKSKDLKLIS